MNKKNDGRKLSHSLLEEMRVRAVRQIVDEGQRVTSVAKAFGIHRQVVSGWVSAFRQGGPEALKAKPIPGRPTKLSDEQLLETFLTVTQGDPLQLQFAYALWTIDMVKEFIWKQFSVKMGHSSVGEMLHKMGLSCQKPLAVAYQKDPVATEAWVREEYPEIKQLAKKEQAHIYFGDEAGVKTNHRSGSTWGVVGETPVVCSSGARASLNMLSAISPHGGMRFMTHYGKVDSGVFCKFLGRLIYNAKQKVFLVVDGHSIHKSKEVKLFLQKHQDKLRIFCLPPYSPELNPDEMVWSNVKGKIGRATIKGLVELKNIAQKRLRSLQKSPGKILGFFRTATTAYAA